MLNLHTTNWCAVPAPTQDWAELVFPDDEPAEAYDRLWGAIARVCLLDEPDPVATWAARMGDLNRAAATLSDRRFDAIHLHGPGTDLTLGLFRSSVWEAAEFTTVDGIVHFPNLPTEEIFTTPDPERTEGTVTSTKPLVLIDGTVVRDLVVRFEGGRAVDLAASAGGETLRTIIQTDQGATRLGECALVDREGRIGRLGTIFYDTLLDENAASHIALGEGFPFILGEADRDRANNSEIHIDFMIGSDELRVTGITESGDRVPVLVEGRWQI